MTSPTKTYGNATKNSQVLQLSLAVNETHLARLNSRNGESAPATVRSDVGACRRHAHPVGIVSRHHSNDHASLSRPPGRNNPRGQRGDLFRRQAANERQPPPDRNQVEDRQAMVDNLMCAKCALCGKTGHSFALTTHLLQAWADGSQFNEAALTKHTERAPNNEKAREKIRCVSRSLKSTTTDAP